MRLVSLMAITVLLMPGTALAGSVSTYFPLKETIRNGYINGRPAKLQTDVGYSFYVETQEDNRKCHIRFDKTFVIGSVTSTIGEKVTQLSAVTLAAPPEAFDPGMPCDEAIASVLQTAISKTATSDAIVQLRDQAWAALTSNGVRYSKVGAAYKATAPKPTLTPPQK